MLFCRELLVVLLVLAVTCSGRKKKETGVARVIGGKPVKDITSYPFVASMQNTCGKILCAAIIIRPHWLLVGDKCVLGIPRHNFRVIAGRLDAHYPPEFCDETTQIRFVEHIFMHPRGEDTDFGLVQLTSEFDFGPRVNKVTRPKRGSPWNLPWVGKTCTAFGWGSSEVAAESTVLIEVNVVVLKQTECEKIIPTGSDVQTTMFCTQSPGKGPCKKDLGAPLICEGVLAGIFMYSTESLNCTDPGYANGWIRADLIHDWIGEVVD